ncbi:MAG: N-acetyltransferase [Armatimonadetes bacterium]|nr:N-acetyltransferase [Armatimonadota bacterium]
MAQILRAKATDAKSIQTLINTYAAKDAMLPRALNSIYEHIRDFHIVVEDNMVLGCCALHVTWGDLAEIRSLAVDECAHGRGYGRLLVERCLEDARELGLPKVFALTYIPDFFEKLGFSRINKSDLPHKIWSECINCPKFPDCGEEAVALEI